MLRGADISGGRYFQRYISCRLQPRFCGPVGWFVRWSHDFFAFSPISTRRRMASGRLIFSPCASIQSSIASNCSSCMRTTCGSPGPVVLGRPIFGLDFVESRNDLGTLSDITMSGGEEVGRQPAAGGDTVRVVTECQPRHAIFEARGLFCMRTAKPKSLTPAGGPRRRVFLCRLGWGGSSYR